MIFSLLLGSCAGGKPMQLGSATESVPSERAMVMPPAAGPGIVGVIERRYTNAIEQNIALYTSAATPGQNMLKVQFFGTAASPFNQGSNTLTYKPITQYETTTEMRTALPTVRMSRSSFFVQNNYGPFGYAFGRGRGSDLCFYAWQQIRAPEGTISPMANYGTIQIRLRICEADATEAKLLAVMYNFTITGAVDAGGWNPYGDPAPVSQTLGRTGSPIWPRPITDEPIVPVLAPAPAVIVNRPAAARPIVAPARVEPQQPTRPSMRDPSSTRSPTIPSPTGAGMGTGTGTGTNAAGSNVSSRPLIPSPSSVGAASGAGPTVNAGVTANERPANSRVNIPSPSCVDMNAEQRSACR